MKRLVFSEDIFHTLAQMEDKEAGQMAKAIACYAHDGTLPKWSNSILMALFSLFRKQIDMQTDSEEKRRIVNKENAKGRNRQKQRAAKTMQPTDQAPMESDSAAIPYEGSEPQPVATESTPFERMAAIYPKIDSLDSCLRESQVLWESLDERARKEAIGYVSKLRNNPDGVEELGYLRQYLTARPWEKQSGTHD